MLAHGKRKAMLCQGGTTLNINHSAFGSVQKVGVGGSSPLISTIEKKLRFCLGNTFGVPFSGGACFFSSRGQTKSVKLLPRLLFSMLISCSATRFGVCLDLVFFSLTALLPRQHLWCAVRRGRLFFLLFAPKVNACFTSHFARLYFEKICNVV